MELLKKLTNEFAPSGREDNLADFITKEITPYVEDIYTDALGNLIAHKKGNGKNNRCLTVKVYDFLFLSVLAPYKG